MIDADHGETVTPASLHFTTDSDTAACGRRRPLESLTGDATAVTCEPCRMTASWLEYAELQEFADTLDDGADGDLDLITYLRGLLEHDTFGKWRGVLIDIQTAHVVTQVYDHLKPEQQDRYRAMSLQRMAALAWKLARRG